jgi:sodium pump decarboxylase gamma subunit
MKDLAFGLTMTVMGMGVTFITLFILIVIIRLLVKLYPYRKEETENSGK